MTEIQELIEELKTELLRKDETFRLIADSRPDATCPCRSCRVRNENDTLADVCYKLVVAVEARIRRGNTKGEAMMAVAQLLAAETGLSTGKAFCFVYKIC